MREYITKQETVLATQITDKGTIEAVDVGVYKYSEQNGCIRSVVEFTIGAKQAEPKVGDYIKYASKDDVYLVDKEVFEKKHSKKGSTII